MQPLSGEPYDRQKGAGSFIPPRVSWSEPRERGYVFVNSVQITKTANRTRSFSNDMRSIGKVPGSILVSYQVLHGPKSRRPPRPFDIGPEELVHCIERIRTGDGVKMALSYTYLPCSLFPLL